MKKCKQIEHNHFPIFRAFINQEIIVIVGSDIPVISLLGLIPIKSHVPLYIPHFSDRLLNMFSLNPQLDLNPQLETHKNGDKK